MMDGTVAFTGPEFAVPAQSGETPVRIFNVTTQSLVEAIVQTPGGQVRYDGDASIDGVPGTAAPIGINFQAIDTADP